MKSISHHYKWMVGKLLLAGTEDLGGAGELAGVTEHGAETEERAGEFVGREAEGDGALIMGDGLGCAAKHVARPRELVGDLRNVGKTGVEFLQ